MMLRHIIQCVLLWKMHFVNVPLANDSCHRVQRGSSGGQHWYDTWSLSVEHSVKMCSRRKHPSNISCLNNVTKCWCHRQLLTKWIIDLGFRNFAVKWHFLTVCQDLFDWQPLWPFTWQTLKTGSHNVPSIHSWNPTDGILKVLPTRIKLIFICFYKRVNSHHRGRNL